MMIVFRNQCEIHCRLSNVCFSIRGVIFCICTISYFSFSSMLFLMISSRVQYNIKKKTFLVTFLHIVTIDNSRFVRFYDFVIVFAYSKEYVYLLLNAKFYRYYWCFIWYLYFCFFSFSL